MDDKKIALIWREWESGTLMGVISRAKKRLQPRHILTFKTTAAFSLVNENAARNHIPWKIARTFHEDLPWVGACYQLQVSCANALLACAKYQVKKAGCR